MGTEQPAAASQIFIPKAPLLSPSKRFAVAWLVTVVVLPYAAARVLTFGLNGIMPEGRYIALLLIAILAVVGLTYNLGSSLQETGYKRHLVWLIVVPWAAFLGVLVGVYNGDALPDVVVWLVMVLATIWVAWAAWMFFRPMAWTARLGILAVLVLFFAAGIGLVKVDGLTGAAHVNFAWRWSRPADVNWAELAGAGVADLKPTPNDYPQFLGPNRLGILPNVRLVSDWNQSPPRELWRRPVGVGWSSFAVVGKYAFTQEQRAENECVCCYRIQDGSPVWVYQDPVRFDKSLGGPGPRATPTVTDGRVFTVGGTGLLNCLDGTTGQRIWSANILEGGADDSISHGVCGSPLVVDDWVIVSPTNRNGTSLAAYDRTTGKRIWQGGTDQASYSSPILADIAGIRQVLLLNKQALAGHDLTTGQVLWSFSWTNVEKVNVSQPVPIPGNDGEFLVATGYGKGCAHPRESPGRWHLDRRVRLGEPKTVDAGKVHHAGVSQRFHLRPR